MNPHNPFAPIPAEEVRETIAAYLDYHCELDDSPVNALLAIPGVWDAVYAHYRGHADPVIDYWHDEIECRGTEKSLWEQSWKQNENA